MFYLESLSFIESPKLSQGQLEAFISFGFQADGEDNAIPQYPYYMTA